MIKRLGTFAAALALSATAATLYSAPASAAVCTAGNNCVSQSFSLSATINTYAKITTAPTSFAWSAVNDNTSQSKEVDGGAQSINVAARTSATSGTFAVYFVAPTSIPGLVSSNSLDPHTAIQFTCSGTYTPYSTGGTTGTATTANGGTTSEQYVGTGTSSLNYCASFTGGESIASTALSLDLFLNDQFLPADTYSTGNTGGTPFTLYVSAT